MVSVGLLAACGGKEEDTGTNTGTDDTGSDDTGTMVGEANVRVMHLSPDAPAVDVWVDGIAEPVVTDLAFGQGTGYLAVPEGSYTFRVAPAGAGADAAVLTFADLALADGSASTAVAFGMVSDITGKALADDETGMMSGDFRVRVMHAAPGVGEVDIWALTDNGATPLLENVPFGADAVLDLPSAAYDVGFDVDNDAVPDVTFSLPALPEGFYVNLYATNDVSGAVYLLAQLPDGTIARVDPNPVEPPPTAQLRFLHLSPDAPAVDVWVDGIAEPVASSLDFTEGTAYVEVPAGTYTARIAPAGTSPEDAVLVVNGLTLESGGFYSATAYDNVASLDAFALVDDVEGIAAGTWRGQIVHAAPAVGDVDLWALTDGGAIPLLEDVPFGAYATLDLADAAVRVGVDVDDDANPDLTFAVPALGSGTFADVYAVNDTSGSVFLLAHLPDGSTVRIDPEAAEVNAYVRVLHLSPDAPAVDVHVDGIDGPVLTGVSFSEGSAYLEVPAGTYTFRITAEGADPSSAVLVVDGVALAADTYTTAVAVGGLAEISALALVDDSSDIPAGNFRAQVVHAAEAVGQVDIWEVSSTPTPLIVDFDFGAAVTADLPVSAYNLGVDVDNDANPDLGFAVPALAEGSFTNVYAVNDSAGNVFLLAQLSDGSLVQIDPS